MSLNGPLPSLDDVGGTAWDAVVIGAGPAGSIAARQLAECGARVLLVEKRRFPRAKVCGACLNGQALSALRSAGLGSLVANLGGVELEEFLVRFRGRTARLALPVGVAVSRARLDAALVDAATDSGAHFLQETQATAGDVGDGARPVQLERGGRTVVAEARVVLAAAGLGNHCLSGEAAARTRIAPGSRIGAGCVVVDVPDSYVAHAVFMAVGRSGYVGMVRVEDGSLNVAAAFEPEFIRRAGSPGIAAAGVLAEAGFPPIMALESARWQGTVPLTRRTDPVAEERLFLLGDAAGYVEPFTGEGIAWAMASGQALAPLALRAIERWDPGLGREWSALHRRLVGRRQLVCRAVATALRRPWLAHLAFEVFTRTPGALGCVLRRLNAPPSFSKAS